MASWSALAKSLVFVSAIASLCAAQEPAQRHSRHKERNKQLFGHKPTKVLPPNAIVVLDPGVDARGEPHPILRKTDPDGDRLEVDIPETVHVHRYFPAGRCQFQAQYFAGGPTIVVAKHPCTNERVYVHLDLAAGYPTVHYDDYDMEYEYPEESFTIHFEQCGEVTTSYSRCGAVKSRLQEANRECKEKALDCAERLRLNQIAERVGKEARELGAGTTDRAGQFIAKSGELIMTAANLVPGIQLLKSKAEDEAAKHRDRTVERVSRERARGEESIKTLR